MLSALLLSFTFVGFLKSLILFFFFLAAILLLVIILLQEPKGGGLAAAFGGAGAETFGVQSGGVNRFTAYVAGAFMVLAILYAAIRPGGGDDVAPTDRATPGMTAPSEPGSDQPGGGEGGGEDE